MLLHGVKVVKYSRLLCQIDIFDRHFIGAPTVVIVLRSSPPPSDSIFRDATFTVLNTSKFVNIFISEWRGCYEGKSDIWRENIECFSVCWMACNKRLCEYMLLVTVLKL